MTAVLVKLAQPLHTELRDRFFADQVVCPDPRQSAQRHFQRARPIDSPVVWICEEPALELRANLAEIIGVSRETERLRQQHQMLMTIRLPDHFVVAAAPCIEVGNPAEITETSLYTASVVAAPGDFGAGVDGQSEDWKLMLSNLVREGKYLSRECCFVECAGNHGRIWKLNARLEVGIKLNIWRPRTLVRISELLRETKRDLAE